MATMTPGRWINLVAVALGALGALVLYKGSFAFESLMAYDIDDKALGARNRRRQTLQRAGLSLLFASFALQAFALLFD
jgi:hypothetical protein